MSDAAPSVPDATEQQQPLTKNQRKKRRKLLGKLFGKDKRDAQQAGGSDACMHSLAEADCSEVSISLASDLSAAVVTSAAPASGPAHTTSPAPATRKRGRSRAHSSSHHHRGQYAAHAPSAGAPDSHASTASRLHHARHAAPASTVSASLVSGATAALEVASAPAPHSSHAQPAPADAPASAHQPRTLSAAPEPAAAAVAASSAAAAAAAHAGPGTDAPPTAQPPKSACTSAAQPPAAAAAASAAAQPHDAVPPAVATASAGAAACADEDHEAPEEEAVRKKPRRSFVHGNYHGYYGYRLAGGQQEDPRLQVFEAEWFRGRRVLDVGCNVGVVTLAVAVNFHPRTTVGVDIDGKLVGRACRALAQTRSELTQQMAPQEGYIPEPLSAPPSPSPSETPSSSTAAPFDAPATALPSSTTDDPTPSLPSESDPSTAHHSRLNSHAATATTTTTTTTITGHKRSRSDAAHAAAAAQLPAVRRPQPGEWKRLRGAVKALSRVSFWQEDWGSTPARPGTVDTIMCLSVTKWIQLHSGDEGLKRVFRKFHRTLAPGGLLVLEPQPWKSYRSAMRKQRQAPGGVPPLAISTLDQLQLRPHQFLEFLTREVGFELVKEVHVDQSAQGFDRPIYVLRRPAKAAGAAGVEGVREGGGQEGPEVPENPLIAA